ncbi:MAG: hypothetical protein M1822_000746 [Bathelium mastoideum]|nr:MAG: hypothetical protein M1822_000746 [Bathelium mastoideum]
MSSTRQLVSVLFATALVSVEAAMGPYFSTGPVSSNSWIREASSTLVLPNAPSGSNGGDLSLWVGMGTSNGDLIQSIADNYEQSDWSVFAYTLKETSPTSQEPIQAPGSTATPGQQVTMHYKFDDSTGNYTQYVLVNGKQVSTLSTSDGQAQGWGSAVECAQTNCGTVPAHSWINTSIILNSADPDYINTLGKSSGVTGTMTTSDGGVTWTVLGSSTDIEDMDPLSITAGILAIIGAVNSSISVTLKFCEAHQELNLLRDELDHFCAIIQEIESMGIELKRHKSLFTVLQQSKTIVTSLEKQLNQRILAREGKMAVRLAWLKHSFRLRDLRKQLQLSRSKIVEALGVANLGQGEVKNHTEQMMNQMLSVIQDQKSAISTKASSMPPSRTRMIQVPRTHTDSGLSSGGVAEKGIVSGSLPSFIMQLPKDYDPNLILLNLSMQFRDRCDREKFFLTYVDGLGAWKRLTISCDYRDLPMGSVLADLKTLKYQHDKADYLLQILWDALSDILFYSTTTNLKLEERHDAMHVFVTEDTNETVLYPNVSSIRFLRIPHYSMRDVQLTAHLHGFSYKVTILGQKQEFVLKQIPSPDSVEGFLKRLIVLRALDGNPSIVPVHGVIVESDDDDNDRCVIAHLEPFAARGTLTDIIYDSRDIIPWVLREQWAWQIVEGLAGFHDQGYVHGHLDMSHIVVDEHDNAQILGAPSDNSVPVGWEPPELSALELAGLKLLPFVTQKTDIFQLGMVLWGLAMMQDEPERQDRPLDCLVLIERQVPLYFRTIVQQCLDGLPANRPIIRDILKLRVRNSDPPEEEANELVSALL